MSLLHSSHRYSLVRRSRSFDVIITPLGSRQGEMTAAGIEEEAIPAGESHTPVQGAAEDSIKEDQPSCMPSAGQFMSVMVDKSFLLWSFIVFILQIITPI